MEERGRTDEEVLQELRDVRSSDCCYGEGRILSSMCTRPHPAAVEAHREFVETNLGDPGLFPGTADLEREVVDSLLELTEGPMGSGGYLTTGGTESNLQALRVFRELSDTDEPEVVLPESAHFSFDKAAELLGIELKKAELDDEYRADPASVEELVTEDTVALVAIAGTTETGQVDPVEELAEVAGSRGLFLHVDAAFGGFVLPFLDDGPKFDFSIPVVDSITVDPHKMGLSTVPAGGLLLRGESLLEPLETETPYLTSESQHSLVGTRTGAGAASAYAAMQSLGKEGYSEVVEGCMENTRYLADRVEEMKGAELTVEPALNLVSVATDDPAATAADLEDRGWQVSVSRLPEALRIVVMPHLDREDLGRFADDLEEVA